MKENNIIDDIVYQLEILENKINCYQSNNTYVYVDVFENWVKNFNDIIVLYNRELNGKVSPHEIDDWDFSSTKKTIRDISVKIFKNEVEKIIEKFKLEIDELRAVKKEKQIPVHQMRRCFKIGAEGCPVNPLYEKNKVFIAMSFDDMYVDSYTYGIKEALDRLGMRYYRADSNVLNIDIMCKICREIQSCGLVIVNISGLNPNVMLELGLAYGIGKPVIIIKDKNRECVNF
ncbi:TIR domain-containing protein, partial [Pectinatus frisingensis]|uniref:hypothetical protein n=1 Tax=Pectinatus frisingensis TaxID=865 RepID=UPI0018C7E4B6